LLASAPKTVAGAVVGPPLGRPGAPCFNRPMQHWNNKSNSLQPLALPEGFRSGDLNEADAFIQQCPHYRPTSLHHLDRLAGELGIGGLSLKDEGNRFGLRSFKGLGGPYAVITLACRRLQHEGHSHLLPKDLLAAADGQMVSPPARELTVACASAGNHGQGVAAGARLIGAACRVFLPAATDPARVEAIEAYGAEVIRVDALYDGTVAEARRQAEAGDWLFVPDSSIHGDREAARRVMLAYGTLMREAAEQMQADKGRAPSHIFIQGGVGGLAGGLAAWARRYWGEQRPRIVVVEAESADCLMQSAMSGGPARSAGNPSTELCGMDCAEASPLAWAILASTADHFLTVEDHVCQLMVTRLADQTPAIHSSLSGAAGISPLPWIDHHQRLRDELKLDNQSHVLGVLTEAPI